MAEWHGPSPLSPIRTGLTCRCPRCGRGKLFDGYLTLAERCAVCGLALQERDSGDGPAVFVIFILGAVIVPLALCVEAAMKPPYWVHGVVWTTVVIAGSLALLRPLKGLMVALQYRHGTPDQ